MRKQRLDSEVLAKGCLQSWEVVPAALDMDVMPGSCDFKSATFSKKNGSNETSRVLRLAIISVTGSQGNVLATFQTPIFGKQILRVMGVRAIARGSWDSHGKTGVLLGFQRTRDPCF